MKHTIAFSVVAALAVLGSSVSAQAQTACPENTQSFDNVPNSFRDGLVFHGFQGSSKAFDGHHESNWDDCWTPKGEGVGEITTGEIVADLGDDDEPTGDGTYKVTEARVYGPNGSALGNGAKVGSFTEWVPASCSTGTVNGDGDGCVEDDAIFTPAKSSKVHAVKNGTAIGAKSNVQHDDSTAIGAGAKSTDTNQVTLGTKDETIRAEGIPGKKARDRQQGPVAVVTSDSGGRLATDGGEIFNRLGSHDSLLTQHSAKLEDHSKGLAISMAMPDAWLSDTKSFGVFGSVGGFDGETAVGFAAIGRIDETFSLNAKFGADTSFKEFGWQAGVGAQW